VPAPIDAKERLKAEMMFVQEGKTARAIAAALGVSENTLSAWVTRGQWVRQRRARLGGTSQATLDVLKRQRELLIGEIGVEHRAAPEQIDALHKLTLSIEKIESRMESIGPMLDAIGRFAEFVAAGADDADCATVRKWIEKYFDEQRRRSQ